MVKSAKIAIFEGKQIRRHWDGKQEKWYFSVIDVVEVLTGSTIPRRYWSDLKIKLQKEGSEVYEKIVQLKMKAADEKYYQTDAAEMFLQTAAEGFEAKPDTLETAGIPRVRSNEVVIVNLDKINPHYFNTYVDPSTDKLSPYGKIGGGFFDMVSDKLSQALVQNKNGEVERFTYSTPHGVVEPNQIPT